MALSKINAPNSEVSGFAGLLKAFSFINGHKSPKKRIAGSLGVLFTFLYTCILLSIVGYRGYALKRAYSFKLNVINIKRPLFAGHLPVFLRNNESFDSIFFPLGLILSRVTFKTSTSVTQRASKNSETNKL